VLLAAPVSLAMACEDEPDLAPVADLMANVDQERYLDDLRFIARERPPGSPHHRAVQDRSAERLASLGFSVERQDYGSGVNIIGRLEGTRSPDETVLISAHYDHIPGCPGADDNATGVAGALEAARVLRTPRPRTLVVALWDEEENGFGGSEAYASRLMSRGEADHVVVSFVLEMIGYTSNAPNSQQVPPGFDLIFPSQVQALANDQNRGDFLVIIPDTAAVPYAERLEAHAAELGLPTLSLPVPGMLKNNPLANDLRRSDHRSFWEVDVPAMMLGDTANFRNPNYHCFGGPDVVDDLDHGFARRVIAATVGAAADALQDR
jgi:hypothetical protein